MPCATNACSEKCIYVSTVFLSQYFNHKTEKQSCIIFTEVGNKRFGNTILIPNFMAICNREKKDIYQSRMF